MRRAAETQSSEPGTDHRPVPTANHAWPRRRIARDDRSCRLVWRAPTGADAL